MGQKNRPRVPPVSQKIAIWKQRLEAEAREEERRQGRRYIERSGIVRATKFPGQDFRDPPPGKGFL